MLEGKDKQELASAVDRLTTARKALDDATGPKRRTEQAKIDRLVPEVERLHGLINVATFRIAAAQAIIDAIDGVLVELQTASATSPAPIETLILYELIQSEKASYILYCATPSAGGESIYERKLGTDKAHHVGGATIAWFLARGTDVLSSGLRTRVGQITSTLGEAPRIATSVPMGPALSETDPTPARMPSGGGTSQLN